MIRRLIRAGITPSSYRISNEVPHACFLNQAVWESEESQPAKQNFGITLV